MQALGDVHLVGVDWHTATKLLYTVVLVAVLVALRYAARGAVRLFLRGRANTSPRFWARQVINLAMAVLFGLGVLSIWFDNGLHAAAAVGIVTAATAFALQKAITSLAGYFLILRGDIFTVGDRIVMGGVRGDVIGLGFLRTTILEMGQPRGDHDENVPVWVEARRYTGRVVTVANAAVFDQPVYNYSREFSFLWEEVHVQIAHDSDHELAERILLAAVARHAGDERAAVGHAAMQRMRRRFFVPMTDLEPEVFYTLNSSWLELAVRFIVPIHGIRRIKSEISREILERFHEVGIEFAPTATYTVATKAASRPAPYPS